MLRFDGRGWSAQLLRVQDLGFGIHGSLSIQGIAFPEHKPVLFEGRACAQDYGATLSCKHARPHWPENVSISIWQRYVVRTC